MAITNIERINNLVDHIEAHLDQDINILELAGSFGMSPWHFQRLFKSLIGDAVGSYTKGRRLTYAAKLLIDTKQSILDIALQVGFNSHEAFTRSFKSQFSFTPKEIRSLRPSINLSAKPVLTAQLIHFLSTRIEKEPTIQMMPARRAIGFEIEIASPFVDSVHCSTIAEPWIKLLPRIPEIVSDMYNANLLGVTMSSSGNFTEEILKYVAAVEVSDSFRKPDDMIEIVIPEQLTATFEISSNVQDDNLKQKVDSIYGYWLLNANYDRGHGNDYEIFTNIVDAISGKFDARYILPVKPLIKSPH